MNFFIFTFWLLLPTHTHTLKKAYQLDPNTAMFMNEYDTIKYPGDSVATPYKYLEKLEEIQSYPGSQGLLAGISNSAVISFHFWPAKHPLDESFPGHAWGSRICPYGLQWWPDLNKVSGPNQAQ